MGDRVSISFKTGTEESVTLFDHWGGMDTVEVAQAYGKTLSRDNQVGPLDRREPNTVMVDFIRTITEGKGSVTGSLYLGATPSDGDNSDNGHHVIDLT